jgi:hypothetical protein
MAKRKRTKNDLQNIHIKLKMTCFCFFGEFGSGSKLFSNVVLTPYTFIVGIYTIYLQEQVEKNI